MLSTKHLEAGTVAYMAPECFQLHGGVNEKCDIYALGMILWQCVTGQKPYKGYPSQFTIIYEARDIHVAGQGRERWLYAVAFLGFAMKVTRRVSQAALGQDRQQGVAVSLDVFVQSNNQ